MAWDENQLRPQTKWRLDCYSVQARRLEGAGGIHAPLQHQVGGLPAEPQVASRNRQRCPMAKRNQARQLGITERTMSDIMRDELGAPDIVDRSTFQAEL